MKKRISVLMLTLALCLSLGAPALAAGAGVVLKLWSVIGGVFG